MLALRPFLLEIDPGRFVAESASPCAATMGPAIELSLQ
jgi:hypothetical protein